MKDKGTPETRSKVADHPIWRMAQRGYLDGEDLLRWEQIAQGHKALNGSQGYAMSNYEKGRLDTQHSDRWAQGREKVIESYLQWWDSTSVELRDAVIWSIEGLSLTAIGKRVGRSHRYAARLIRDGLRA